MISFGGGPASGDINGGTLTTRVPDSWRNSTLEEILTNGL